MKTFIFSLFFILYSLNIAVSQNTLCDTYGGNTPDTVFQGTHLASSIDFTTWEGKHILVEGNILLDADIILKDCILEVNKPLFIEGGGSNKTIVIENCKAYRCGFGKAYSFFVKTNSNGIDIKISDSHFENFVELIHLEEPLKVDCQNNIFTGVPLDLGHAFHFLDYDGDLMGADFIFKNNTINECTGIWLDRCRQLKIDNNIFNNGIYGIYDSTNGFGAANISNNTFNNCNIGINAGRITEANYIYNNQFNNTKTGISAKFETAFITNNTYDYHANGHSNFLIAPDGNINLMSNHISANSNNTGFDLSGGGNVYAFGNTHDVYYGGAFMDIRSRNSVTLTDNIGVGAHISLKGVDDHNSYGNEIESHNGSAFYTAMSNGRYCSNTATSAGILFNFQGNCMNTDFSNNEMGKGHSTSYGTGLKVDDVIGIQSHKGNKWNSAFAIEGATNTSIEPLFSLFSVNPNAMTGGDPKFLPGTYSPQTWFFPDISIADEADCQSTNFHDPSTYITAVDRAVINGTYNTTPISNWLAIRNLIRKLIDNPTLLADADAYDWYTNMDGTSAYTVAEIETIMASYYGTSDEAAQIRGWGEAYLQDPINNQNLALQIASLNTAIVNNQPNIRNAVQSMLVSMNPQNDYEEIFRDIYTIYVDYLEDPTLLLTNTQFDIVQEVAKLCPLSYGPAVYIGHNMADVYNITYDEVTIRNLSGQKLITSTSNQVDVKTLPNGIYLVEVDKGMGTEVHKLIIQH